LKDQQPDKAHFEKMQALEGAIHVAVHNMQAALIEHEGGDASNLTNSSFLIMVGNPVDGTNPEGKNMDIRGLVVDSNLEMTPEMLLKEPMNLTRLTIPLEQRLVYAIKHIWDQVGVKLLNDSPPVALAGTPVEEGD